MLPLLFYCCYRRSEFNAEFRLKFQSGDQDCLGARYVVHTVVHSAFREFRDQDCLETRNVVHLRCTVHSRRSPVLFPFLSWNHGSRALSRLSAYLLYSHGAFVTSCAVTVHSPVQLVPALIYLLGSSPVCCSVQCWRSRNAQNEVGSRSEVGSIQRI